MASYLLGSGLLDARRLVEGDVSIEEVGGLNRNFFVRTSDKPSYFLKQARYETGEAGAVRVEANFYRRLQQDSSFAALRPFVPPVYLYDDEQQVLVLGLLSDGRGVYDFVPDGDALGLPAIGGELARALAACHSASLSPDLPNEPGVRRWRQVMPWALNMARPVPEALIDLAPAQLQLVQIVQRSPGTFDALDQARADWNASCLIHADIKWSNVLIDDSALPDNGRVKLVDWELVGIGDAAWDVGSVFHSYVAHCVADLPLEEGATAERAATAFGNRLPLAQEHVRAFWQHYTELAPQNDTQRFLNRTVRYCAARLLQSTYEWSQHEMRMPRAAVGILQLGLNMLLRPEEAQVVVLGIPVTAFAGV